MTRSARQSYKSDITYGTNNEFGFDYLRDNMKFRLEDCVQQRGHNFAIVDEVDSILIDEARTPLIISGPSEESTDKYYRVDKIIPKLIRGEVIEGKEPGQKFYYRRLLRSTKSTGRVTLTEEGAIEGRAAAQHARPVRERRLGRMKVRHHVEQALKAHVLLPARQGLLVRTARSSSSTSSPAASCRDAAGAMVCTRRSKPRKA